MMVIDDWNALVKGNNDEVATDFICAVKSIKELLSRNLGEEEVRDKMRLYFEIGMQN